MGDIVVTTVLAVSRLLYLIGFLAPAVALIYIFMALAHLKPGVRLWLDAPLLNPLNHIFFSGNFTKDGLKYRRRVLIATVTFFLVWSAGIGLDMVASRQTSRSSGPASPAAERPFR